MKPYTDCRYVDIKIASTHELTSDVTFNGLLVYVYFVGAICQICVLSKGVYVKYTLLNVQGRIFKWLER